MSAQDNAATVRAVEEAWNTSDLAALDQHFADDFDNSASAMPGIPAGLEGAKMVHQGAMQSFPDRSVEIVDLVADDDQVVVHGRITGTNQGGFELLGAGPNGNPIDFHFVGIYTMRDGKVASHWGLNDAQTLWMQLHAGEEQGRG
jgi:predicted ester cyclase